VLNVSNISKSYNAQHLFNSVSFSVGMRGRIAVIGQNVTGKTTLFEIISGNISPDSGTISVQKGATIGYLNQDINPASGRKLLEEVATSSASINSIAHKIQMLQEELAEIEALFAEPENHKDSQKVIEIQQAYRRIKEFAKALSSEWDRLIAEAERMTQGFQTALKNIKA